MRKRKGFTLIELLVVIAIIAILAIIILIALNNARRKARDARAESDLRSIAPGLELYNDDCGAYPFDAAAAGGTDFSEMWVALTTAAAGACDPGWDGPYASGPEPLERGTAYTYTYYSAIDGTSYELCTDMDLAPSPFVIGNADLVAGNACP